MKKIKVTWICHFSNPNIREHLEFSLPFFKRLMRYLGMKTSVTTNDYAPWVSNMAKEIADFKNVELSIISPHRYLKKRIQCFVDNNIRYCFFKPDKDYFIHTLYRRIFRKSKPKFRINRQRISKILKSQELDMIVLIGSENPYYSISVLDIKEKPIMLIAQTVYTNPEREKHSGNVDPFRWDLELKIHKSLQYFSCNGPIHQELILKNNKNAVVFRHRFPMNLLVKNESVQKKFDFIFFSASLSKKKGIEDAIQALALVKKRHPEISLDVVGNYTSDYMNYLQTMIKDLNLVENITFRGFFSKQSDMHEHIQQSRFALLPVKLDSIPGTISESMMLDIPIVSYKTTGTPHLNKYGEAVLLCDIDDIEALARNMIRVMSEPDLVESMLNNSRKYIEMEFDNKKNMNMMVNMFHAVYNHYHDRTEIPKELLFDPEEFPSYSAKK